MPLTRKVYGAGSRFDKSLLGPIGTLANPAISGVQLKNAGYASGVYYIKNAQMSTAVQVYVDNTNHGGGWMLCAYGYAASSDATNSNNLTIPNLNHDGSQFSYTPNSRATARGLIASPSGQKSTLLLAKASTEILMAAGGNPSSGGINGYTYAWKFTIPSPSSLTFENHSATYNSAQPIDTVTVTALQGDSGTATRQTQRYSLGHSWSDTYPTGYGAVTASSGTINSGNYNVGPHFPSIHSGSRNSSRSREITSSPDLGFNGYYAGETGYTYRGYYTLNSFDNYGQMSIWFR